MVVVAGLAAALPGTASAQADDGVGEDMPASMTLVGTIRDFRAREQEGGHPDFEWQPRNRENKGSYGQYLQIVADDLDADHKPLFRSRGYRLTQQWRNAEGRNIMAPRDYISVRQGDVNGSKESLGYAVQDAEHFAQWFRDVPGVNASQSQSLTLVRESGTNKYVFDDKNDSQFRSAGGFFPVNNALYGNYGSTGKNFHFTFELATEFEYSAGSGQVFRFIGDDDVWVFIDDKLVIDLGGVHSAVEQTIDLDRLSWLQDGEKYSLRFFFAERHTTQSNFRIETTLRLQDISIPTVSALYD